MIEGVKIKKLRVIPDERGRLMEILRCDDALFRKFGQAYMTTVYPGVVKAWHYHKLLDVFGGGLGLDVRTEGELEDALHKAATADSLVFIEVHTGQLDCPDALRSAGRSMAKANQLD